MNEIVEVTLVGTCKGTETCTREGDGYGCWNVAKIISMRYQNIFLLNQNKFVFDKIYSYNIKIYFYSIKINFYSIKGIYMISKYVFIQSK